MYRKRIKGGRKFNDRMERAGAGRERRRPDGPPPADPPELPGLRRRIVVEVGGRRLPGRMGWARALGLVRQAFVRARAP